MPFPTLFKRTDMGILSEMSASCKPFFSNIGLYLSSLCPASLTIRGGEVLYPFSLSESLYFCLQPNIIQMSNMPLLCILTLPHVITCLLNVFFFSSPS